MIHVITDEIYGSCDAFPDDIYIDSKKYINEGISNSGEIISLYKSWIMKLQLVMSSKYVTMLLSECLVTNT